MAWTNEKQPFGANRAPLLTGLASDGSGVGVPVAVDPVTGAILTEGGGGGGSATVVGIGPVGQYQVAYDTITYTNTSGTVDTYIYKTGGTGGTTTATVTITYTDTSKSQISNVVRT